jgi:hypothetical protein
MTCRETSHERATTRRRTPEPKVEMTRSASGPCAQLAPFFGTSAIVLRLPGLSSRPHTHFQILSAAAHEPRANPGSQRADLLRKLENSSFIARNEGIGGRPNPTLLVLFGLFCPSSPISRRDSFNSYLVNLIS